MVHTELVEDSAGSVSVLENFGKLELVHRLAALAVVLGLLVLHVLIVLPD